VGGAEIAGELVANLQSEGTIILRSTARMFGDVEAKNLVVEEGAVVVGTIALGSKDSNRCRAAGTECGRPRAPHCERGQGVGLVQCA